MILLWNFCFVLFYFICFLQFGLYTCQQTFLQFRWCKHPQKNYNILGTVLTYFRKLYYYDFLIEKGYIFHLISCLICVYSKGIFLHVLSHLLSLKWLHRKILKHKEKKKKKIKLWKSSPFPNAKSIFDVATFTLRVSFWSIWDRHPYVFPLLRKNTLFLGFSCVNVIERQQKRNNIYYICCVPLA